MSTAAPSSSVNALPRRIRRVDSLSKLDLPSQQRPTPPPFPTARKEGRCRNRKGSFSDVDFQKQLSNNSRGKDDPWHAKRDDGTRLPPFAFPRPSELPQTVRGPLFVHERRTQWSKDHYGVLYYRTSWGSTLKPVLPPCGTALRPHFEEIATEDSYLPQSIEVVAICGLPLKVLCRSQWSMGPNGHHATRSMWHEALPPPGHPVFAGCTLHPLGFPHATTAPPTTIAALFPPPPPTTQAAAPAPAPPVMQAYIPPPPPRSFALISAMSEMADRSRALRDEYHAGLVDLANLAPRLKTVTLSDAGLEKLEMAPLSHARLAGVDMSISAAEQAAAEAAAAAFLARPTWPTSPLVPSLELEDDIDDLVPLAPRSSTGAVAGAGEDVGMEEDAEAEAMGGTEEGVVVASDAVEASAHAAGQEDEAGGGQGLVEEEEEAVGSVMDGEEREREEECEQPVEDGYEQLGEEDEQPWEGGNEQPWDEAEQQPEQEEEEQQQSPQQQQQSQAATAGGNKRARDDEEISTSEQLGSPSKRQCSPEQSSVAPPASASTSAADAAAALDDDDDDEEEPFYDLRWYSDGTTASSLIRDSLVMEEGTRRPVIVAAFAPDGDEGWKAVARALGLETGCHARYILWEWLHTEELPKLRRGSSREAAKRFLKTIFPNGTPISQEDMDALKEKSEDGRLPEKLGLSRAHIGFLAQAVRRRFCVYSKYELEWCNSYLPVEADDEELLQPAVPLLYNSRSWSWKLVELQDTASMPAADFCAWGDEWHHLLDSRTHRSLHRFFSFWVPRMPNEGERPCGCELDEAEGDEG